MRAQDIRVGQILYWDASAGWQLAIRDQADRAVEVRGRFARYTRAVDQRTVVPARPGTGRAGVWCHSAASGEDHIIAPAQLRGLYADVIAGRLHPVRLSDDQHYAVQLLANGGSLHQSPSAAQGYYIKHGHVGRITVRKPTVEALLRLRFVERSTAPRANWWQEHDLLFTSDGQTWYDSHPRKPGVAR